jgi:hypothetical protein
MRTFTLLLSSLIAAALSCSALRKFPSSSCTCARLAYSTEFRLASEQARSRPLLYWSTASLR